VVLVALLDQESDAAVLSWEDTDGLFHIVSILLYLLHRRMSLCRVESRERSVGWIFHGGRTLLAMEPSFCLKSANCSRISLRETYLAAVNVPQVERVARELHAVRPLDKRCAVSLCPQSAPNPPYRLSKPHHSLVISHARSPGIVAAISLN
jgi:hypothetical protein